MKLPHDSAYGLYRSSWGLRKKRRGICPALAEGLGFRVRISSYKVDVSKEGDHALRMQALGLRLF